jgi:uncharacterized protein YcbX
MRRSLPFRLFAALFAPWFAVVVAEPVPIHNCPIHSVHAVAAHSMADHTMMADGAMDHAAAPQHQGTPLHGSHKHCCCPDSSCASVAVAFTSSAPQLEWVPEEIQRDVPRSTAVSFVLTSAEHVLPFGNGPPAARA